MPQVMRVTAENAHVLGNIAPDVFDAEIDPARLAAFLAERTHLLFVALAEGQVVGQCAAVIHRHPDQATELYIDNLGVAPTHRRLGIALALIEAAIERGRAMGCEEAWVGTETDNHPARGLYRRFGKGQESVFYYWELAKAETPELSPQGRRDTSRRGHGGGSP